MASGCYCLQISSIVAAVGALRKFGGNFDSTFVVDGRIFWEIVAHPQKRNQFAIRTWDNGVYVIEPSHELGGEWGLKGQ